jgi:hypothetical protein
MTKRSSNDALVGALVKRAHMEHTVSEVSETRFTLLEALPPEMRAHMRSFLPALTRLRAKCVSRAWCAEDAAFQLPLDPALRELVNIAVIDTPRLAASRREAVRLMGLAWLDAGALTWRATRYTPMFISPVTNTLELAMHWRLACPSGDPDAWHVMHVTCRLAFSDAYIHLYDNVRAKDMRWCMRANGMCHTCSTRISAITCPFVPLDAMLRVMEPWFVHGTWSCPGAMEAAQSIVKTFKGETVTWV